MVYSTGPLLPFLFVLVSYANACRNFLVQHCTDIPFAYLPIATTKCIQLVPHSYDQFVDYPVENYIVLKSSPCYNIVSFNATSTALFSNECREQCPDEYCLLFDNQSNTSIINIFYSSLSTYKLSSSSSPDVSSYDYLPFDDCSSKNRTNAILLIITYVLCGVIGALTIGVILKYIISWRLKKRGGSYQPYNWRWLRDCLFCCLRETDQPSGRKVQPETGDPPAAGITDHRTYPRNNFDLSAQPYTLSSDSSNNTPGRSINPDYNSGNSSDPRFLSLSSDNTTPFLPSPVTTGYFDFNTESALDPPSMELEDLPRSSPVPLRQRLSEKASAALSVFSSPGDYAALEKKSSGPVYYMRF